MSLTRPTVDQELIVVDDAALVRRMLCRICDAHEEVSLTNGFDDDRLDVPRERREVRRARLQLPVTLIPIEWSSEGDDAVVICGPEQVGVTRDISSTGVGVTHDQILGSEAAIVQFDLPGEGPLDLVLDLRWSVRQTRYCYVSGGRVVGLLGGDSEQ